MDIRWKRVHGLSRCPICNKTDWCMVSPDRSAAICPRVSEGSARHIEGSGYLHILRVTDEWMKEEFIPRQERALPEHNEVIAIRARKWISDCENSHVEELATRLGVTPESLRLLNMGWCIHQSAWVFPMLRTGKRLIGVRIRCRSGKRFAVKGSKNGLFIPNNFPDDGVVYVCEGESDTAAMISSSLPCVGRASCHGGERLMGELLDNRNVVICADRDGPGREGASSLANYLKTRCTGVTMMSPPIKYNDIREWLNGEGKEEVYTTAKRISENAWGQEVHSGSDAGGVDT
jgi:hypothetical protein